MSELRKIPWWGFPIVIAILLVVLAAVANFTGQQGVYQSTAAAINILDSLGGIVDLIGILLLALGLLAVILHYRNKRGNGGYTD